MERVLGLDLGTNSCGWALIDVPTSPGEVGKVVAMGSRVFPAGAEISGNVTTTKAKERRVKRSQRRQIARRSRRRRVLRTELTRLGLLPVSDTDFDALMDIDPNRLVTRSQSGEQLTLREIGRFIYWMSGRRGFLSLRSGGSQVLDDDPDFVPNRYRLSQYNPSTGERIAQGQEELLIDVLTRQQAFYPDILTDHALFGRRGRLTYPIKPIPRDRFLAGSSATLLDEFGIHGLISFQRAIYWDKGTIGFCSLDPASRQRRAARAERSSQQFVIRQTLMHLRVGDDQRPLSTQERQRLYDVLWTQKTLAFSKVRTLLGLDAEARINFERQDEKGLQGNQVDPPFAKALGDTWRDWSDETRDNLLYLLLGESTEDVTRSQLEHRFGLNREQIDAVLTIKMPPGRMNYSRRTIRRLLPHMIEADNIRDAVLGAGFRTPEDIRAEKGANLGDVTNPLVKTSLTQLGKVLRELARRFEREDGTFCDIVRIELARDVSNSRKIRERITKEQRENQKQRQRAQRFVEEYSPGAQHSSDAIRRVRLYEEQQGRCIYCDRNISATDVLSNRIQIDHILPRALTLDNSMGNVVLVHADENLEKGDRTVFEWLGADGRDRVVASAKAIGLRRGKIDKLAREHVDADHIPNSLLVSTGYLTTLARDFVKEAAGLPANRIQVSRGRITAALLYRTGLHKDADDHRRHAQDAAMVAISSPAIAKQLADRYKAERDRGRDREDEHGAWEPWPGFRADILDTYAKILTSHRPQRKVSGQLHEETNYGRVQSPSVQGDHVYARRRPLTAGFTRKQFTEIADPVIKRILEDDLVARGINPAASDKLTFDPNNPPMFEGKPIKAVRCHISAPDNIILRPDEAPKTTVSSAGNHLAYIYRNAATGKWRMHITNRLDAFRDRAVPESIRRQQFALDGDLFQFSIGLSDVLEITKDSGVEYWRVSSLDRRDSRLYLVPLNASGAIENWRVRTGPLMQHSVVKVVVTPTGLVRRSSE